MAKLFPYYQHIVSKGLGKYKRHASAWSKGQVILPIRLAFPPVTERDALANKAALNNWIKHWQEHPFCQHVIWQDLSWQKIDIKKIPTELEFQTLEDFIRFINKQKEWLKQLTP